MKKSLIPLTILIILAACAPTPPTPYPIPMPTQPPIPLLTGQHQVYFPVLPSPECQHNKRGLAWAHYGRGVPKNFFGLCADMVFHTWGAVGGDTHDGRKMSVIWSDEKNGYQYLDKWGDYIGLEESRSGRPYDGYVLFANEPDRDRQADMTINEVARLFLDAAAICPDCKFVGPMYSAADDGQKVAAVWNEVKRLCGSPCPAMDSLYAHSLHIYPRPQLNYGPSRRVDDLCGYVDCTDAPVWITEMGWRTCYPGVRAGFGSWLREAEADSRVEYVFIYAPYQEPPGPGECAFTGLLVWDAWPEWELTGMGLGVVDGFEGAYP